MPSPDNIEGVFVKLFSSRFITFATSAIVVIAMSVSATPPAMASPPLASEIQDLKAHLTRFGVPAARQESLVDKLLSGEAWDVFTGRDQSGPTEHVVMGTMSYTITRYADGSFKAMGLEIPRPEADPAEALNGRDSPKAITRCTYSTGSGYHNASN